MVVLVLNLNYWGNQIMKRKTKTYVSSLLALSAAAWITAPTLFAQTGPVYSVNMVGFQRVDANSLALKTTSTPFNGALTDLDDVINTQLTGGPDKNSADNIWFWDSITSQYRKYFLFESMGHPLSGTWLRDDFQQIAEPIEPGTGFWVIKNNTTDDEIVMVGEVVDDPQITKNLKPGLNLVSYGYSSAISMTDLNLKVEDGARGGSDKDDADNIWVWTGSQYEKYFLFSLMGHPLDNTWLRDDFVNVAVDFQPGNAFWYVRHLDEIDLDWVENKPY